MISKLLDTCGMFGAKAELEKERLTKILAAINQLEPKYKALTGDQLRAMTEGFRQRLQKGETIEQLIPEAFAAVREACVRAQHKPYTDMQLVGGILIAEGKLSRMPTGEGKSITATLTIYLDAIKKKNIAISCLTDALAKRDAAMMESIFNLLGVKVGLALTSMDSEAKAKVYESDIALGTRVALSFDHAVGTDLTAVELDEADLKPIGYPQKM